MLRYLALPQPSRSALEDSLILVRLAVLYGGLGLLSHYVAAWTMRQVGAQFHIDSQFLMLDALFAASVMLGSLVIAWLLQPTSPLRWLFGAHISLRGVLLAVLGVGMLALRQFAVMRYRLVGIVEERTRSLLEKTLELERLATQDNLTGLFNRRYADAWLAQQLQVEARHPQQLTVALADIDHFKQINDHHSHATGDEVLRRVAAILQRRCRAADLVARYGGEEFLFCFPGTGLREATSLCEDLRLAVAAADWSDLGLRRGVTLSFGLATSRAGASLETLLREADARLYAAKDSGRNRVFA